MLLPHVCFDELLVRERSKDEREQSVIFNTVGLLSQTSDDVSSEKTKKVSKRKRTGSAEEYAKPILTIRETTLRAS